MSFSCILNVLSELVLDELWGDLGTSDVNEESFLGEDPWDCRGGGRRGISAGTGTGGGGESGKSSESR